MLTKWSNKRRNRGSSRYRWESRRWNIWNSSL